ncbi:phage distal tail protein [Streptomyces sp. NPDC056937]|uniref:phage distal tail protein n=1 Tax=Streptomyces sp. NPDC056937 TaxID=3345969 RepID=UPI00363CB1DB
MAETTNPNPDDTSPGSLITRDGQIQWAGLLMGPGTPYEIDRTGITGWDDLPELDTGDVPRPDQHGSWPGARWAKSRVVGTTVWLLPETVERAGATAAAFRAATGPDGGERWLAVRLHGETLAVLARISRRVVPQDRGYVRSGTSKISLQWTATDPRRYGTVQHRASTVLPAPEPGLNWQDTTRDTSGDGLSWPLDWGATGVAGTLTAANAGDAPAHPVVQFRGPVRRPALTRLSDGRQLQYDIVLGAGDVLTADTDAGTVLLNGTASRLYTAALGSAPEQLFQLGSGGTELAFRSDDTTSDARASATVLWRDAHW